MKWVHDTKKYDLIKSFYYQIEAFDLKMSKPQSDILKKLQKICSSLKNVL